MLRLVAIASVVALANAAGHKVGLASVGVVDGESEIRAPKTGGDIKYVAVHPARRGFAIELAVKSMVLLQLALR